jgi:hypothetical protein
MPAAFDGQAILIGIFSQPLMENGTMPAYMNHHPKFQVELPAIAAGVKANAAVLLELLRKIP